MKHFYSIFVCVLRFWYWYSEKAFPSNVDWNCTVLVVRWQDIQQRMIFQSMPCCHRYLPALGWRFDN